MRRLVKPELTAADRNARLAEVLSGPQQRQKLNGRPADDLKDWFMSGRYPKPFFRASDWKMKLPKENRAVAASTLTGHRY
jgi:hypothetical protein